MITLSDLMHNMTVQGDVRIRIFNSSNYDEIAMKLFRYVDDLFSEDIPSEWEELEVRYMFVADNVLNIELYVEDEE